MLLFSHSCRFGKLTEARYIHSSGAAFNGIWEGHPIPERHKLSWDRTAAAGKAASYDVHESKYPEEEEEATVADEEMLRNAMWCPQKKNKKLLLCISK